MKHATWGLMVLLFVIGVAIGFRFGLSGNTPVPNPTPTPAPTGGDIACTMEARQCPDGSFVGRSGPRCEFAQCPSTRRVSLYYYDASRDTDASGNLLCSAQGVVAVQRDIPLTQTPIQDAVRLLLSGELTAAERARGITTEYPLPGVGLIAASLREGVLTLTLTDSDHMTGGGSCRVGILWAQIKATALQFDGVREVLYAPEELFQP